MSAEGESAGAPVQGRDGVRAVQAPRGLPQAAVAVFLAAAFAPALAMAQVAGSGAAPAVVGGGDKPITIGVQEITAYESNPAHGNSLNATYRGLHGDDVSLSPSVTASYSHGLGLYGVALNGVFGYDYHPRNDLLSSERLSFSIAGNAQVGSHCSAGGNARYDRGQTDLQALTVNVTHNTTQTYALNASESCTASMGLTENVQVTHSATQNSSSQLNNYDTTGVQGLIGYSNHAIGTVGVTASYDQTNYTKSAVGATTPEQLKVSSIGVQISRPIGARLSGSASVSYSHSTQPLTPGFASSRVNSFSGLTTAIGLTYLVGPRLQLATHVSRGVSGAYLQGVGYTVATQVDGSATYKVSSSITTGFGVTWARTDYKGRQLVFNPLLPILALSTPTWQDTTTVYGQASFQIGKRSSIGLNVRYMTGSSDLSLYNYSSTYAGLTLATSF
jgi:hypothetical protein